MKNKKKNTFGLRLVGVIALAAVIGFSMAACADPTSTSGGNPPLTGTVTIIGIVEVGQTLTANTDALGGIGTITYQWKRGGNTNIGANNSAYVVQAADIGATITVTVTRAGYSGAVTSNPTTAVTEPLPALTGTVSISGTAEVGTTLTADTSALGGTGTISYQWKRGSAVVGANSSTYQVQAADVGETITVTVTRAGNTGAVTSTPVVVIDPSLPDLSGTITISPSEAVVGTELTAVYSGSETVSYQWKKDGENVGGNSNKYTPTEAGSYTVVVSASGYNSKISDPVTVTLPPLSGTVSISGTASVGQTLTAVTSALGGSGDISYQWKSGGASVGANSNTYTVQADDTGKTITVTVTRTGNSGSVTSDPTAAVTDTRPALTGTVSISGTAEVGATLSADISALGGSGEISYQWKRGDQVIGGNSSFYHIQAADVGGTITVTVTRTGNSGSVISSPTAAVTIPALSGTVRIDGIAEVGQTLTADTAELGGIGDISYQWKSNNANVGANSSTYVVQSSDIDKTITVTVTRSGSSGSKTSEATTPVPDPNAVPLTGSVTISISEGGSIDIGKTLIAVTTYLDGTGTIYYQWKRGVTNVGTNSSYKVQLPDGGSEITVTVTRQGYSSSVTSTATDVVPIPSLTGSVSITGTAQVEQTLMADITSLGGTAGDISYQWKRGGTVVGTDQYYIVQLADVGSTITVTVSREYYSGSVTSPATSTVPVPPLTGTVSISGNAVMGETLTANTNSLGGTAGTISYQWKRGVTDVGTNQNTYTVVAADVGSTITVTVSREFYTGTVTSPATSTVTYPAAHGPVATANNVTISGNLANVGGGGSPINATITITLSNASVTGVSAGTNVVSWFSPTVGGLSYTVSSLSNGNASVTLSVTGTPTAVSTSAVSISIPVANLLDSNGNPGISSDLAVSGTIAYSIDLPLNAVARIGTTYYADLASAVTGATSGNTITVIKNITLTSTLTIPSDKTITLVAETDGLAISPAESYDYSGLLYVYGTLNLGDPANTSHTPKLIIDGKKSGRQYGSMVHVDGDTLVGWKGTLNMHKGAELRNAGDRGISMNGDNSYNRSTVNMKGGVIAGCNTGVFIQKYSTFTMTGGVIYGTTGGTYGSANTTGSIEVYTTTGTSVTAMSTSITTTGTRTQTYGSAP